MCAKFGCGPTVVSKGGVQTDRQMDTAGLYSRYHSPSQIAARCLPFWYSPRLVFIIGSITSYFWSNPICHSSLAYICASIGILRCSARIGFWSHYLRSVPLSLLSLKVIRSSIIHTLTTPNSITLLPRIAFLASLTLSGSASTT